MLKWPVLCLIVLGALDLKVVASLKIGDVGVCKTKIISMTNKRVTYTKLSNNRWCGKRRCIVRVAKTQPITQAQELATCCKGFEYQSENDVCVAQCTIGCHGGSCVAPDTCQCDPPLYLDPVHRNTCVAPVCDPPCLNAVCTGNNICTCHEGYSSNSSFVCTPICVPLCENGECTAPNVCTCSSGYVYKENKCVPVCSCVNGTCIGDTCSCLAGYSPVNSTHCAPVCDRCDGNCVAPNKCECFDGYMYKDGFCEPVCDACGNGYCSQPNQCTCFEGFVYDAATASCVKLKTDCEGKNCLSGAGEGQCEKEIQPYYRRIEPLITMDGWPWELPYNVMKYL